LDILNLIKLILIGLVDWTKLWMLVNNIVEFANLIMVQVINIVHSTHVKLL
jgi:hypothetical protein